MSFNIAIDGPAGAGKSTIAKKLAKDLGYIYVDTGAMYRAMAYFLITQGVDAQNTALLEETCQKADISIQYVDGEQIVLLNGENVNHVLRTEEVGKMASVSSANGKLREKLVELQQALAAKENVVMDGRDIGTVVLPNADVKIFMTASVEVRAKRRYDELVAKGENADLEVIAKDIEERDYRDSHREVSPLKQAEDAVLLDTSDLDIEQVTEKMKELVLQKKGK